MQVSPNYAFERTVQRCRMRAASAHVYCALAARCQVRRAAAQRER
jgi:hypothetical protein